MRRERCLGAAVLVMGLLSASRASAYCRTTTCITCPAPATGCVTQGTDLYWTSSCLSYDVQQDGSRWATVDQISSIADLAFQSWVTAPCPDGTGTPSITLKNLGPVACDNQEYNDQTHTYGGNANIIIFRDDVWTESSNSDPASTLALTTVTFQVTTGEIFDADIEINGLTEISTATPVPSAAHDLQSILTHETGHFLGMAHSTVACSADGSDCPTMNAIYQAGSDAYRTLEADDVAGICAIFPPDRQATSNSCTPRHGFSGQCGTTTPPPGGGCSVAAEVAAGGAGRTPLAGLCLAGLFALRARRPRNRRRTDG
jgi:hypothetical protein